MEVDTVLQMREAQRTGVAAPLQPVLTVKEKTILPVQADGETSGPYASLLLSDGENTITAVIPVEHAALVDSPDCVPGARVRLDLYICFNAGGDDVASEAVLAVSALTVLSVAKPTPAIAVAVKTEAEKENIGAQLPTPVAVAPAAAPIAPTAAAASPQAAAPAAAAPTSPSSDVLPIGDLNPYRLRWSMKARVTSKSELRAYTNARGSGKMFSVDFADDSGEIRATAFNEHAERLHPLLERGKVYIVSRGTVRVINNPRFNQVRNSYEIIFDANTTITLCAEDAVVLPETIYRFVTVGQISEMGKDRIVDVIGVIKEAGELSSVTNKTTHAKIPKRDIVLYDDTSKEVRVTLWNSHAETFEGTAGTVVAIKGVKANDYNGGRTLSTLQTTSVAINPDLPETARLRAWLQGDGATAVTTTLSVASPTSASAGDRDTRKEIGRLEPDRVGEGAEPDYINIRGSVIFIPNEKATYYPAAPDTGAKVVQTSDNRWVCEKTKKTYDKCDYRYILRASVADFSGNTWVNTFNDIALQIMHVPASTLAKLKDDGKDEAYKSAFLAPLFHSYVFRIRSKSEVYNMESRVRHNVVGLKPIEYAHESKLILRDIHSYGL